MIERVLDDSYPAEVRRDILRLTTGRMWANACFRFAAPFLAVIAKGLNVSLDEIGIAVAISELAGLSSPLVGHMVDRISRRAAMTTGLAGVAVGASLVSASHGRIQFAIGLIVLAQSKVLFDLGLYAWVADHVPYERRGRVVGITETSWALGLLVGVSLLGLLAGATSWRFGYIGGAAIVALMAAVIALRLRDDPASTARPSASPDAPAHLTPRPAPAAPSPDPLGGARNVWRRAWRPVVGAGALMAASQCVFVTFGSWLKDVFGFGAVQLSAVTFLFGGVELLASVTAARRSDTWGKERSVAFGAALMVPAMLLLALTHEHVVPGLALLAVVLVGFEFGIVSALPVGTQLIPGAPARGLGLMLAAGTSGRAVVSVIGTRLYTNHGFGAPMLLGSVAAALAAAAFWPRSQRTITA